MPKASPVQSNFNGGEISPLVYGRVDSERYRSWLSVCKNYVPTIQGGITRRPGTMFVAEVKDSTKKTRLVEFEFSITQAYIIEFGDQYFRFYRNNSQILLTGQSITNITQANPAVLTYSGADTYANGDEVFISGVVGMTQVNSRNFKVANVNTVANTFELQNLNGTNLNSGGFGAYVSGGIVAEVFTLSNPYLESDLFELKFTQSADILYIVHPEYAPRKLTRTGHTSWTLTEIDFLDGPYFPINTTSTTITPSATSGSITLTASSAIFASTDVGRLVRLQHGSTWGYAKITSFTSTTVVNADVKSNFGATTATASWRLGLYSTTTGFPSAVVFHEDRLVFGGVPSAPQRIDGSKSGDYENFAPTDTAGAVADNNAYSFTLNSNDVNVIRWMVSDEKGLIVGTVGGEWIVRPSSQQEAITPTNVAAKQATFYGSADIQPIQAGKAVVFVQRSGKKIRDLNYFFDVDGFRSGDLTLVAEHVTGTGITQISYQKEPHPVVWCIRNDGVLAAMTFEKDEESLKVAWHRQIFGGFSDAASSDSIVESVAVIPSPDGKREEAWVIIKRRINGGTKRYIEYLTKFFEDTDEQRAAFFVDSGLTLDTPVTITNATQANPVVVTAASHGFSNGQRVLITNVKGMTQLNDNSYTVQNVTASTFELTNENNGGGGNVNGTSFSAYVSDGKVRKLVTTVSGLWHLEGESVSILADGAVQPNETVASGSITLTSEAATVHVGLSYMSDGQMLRLEAGSADGTALGKTRRVHRVGFLLHRSLGLKIGLSFDELDELTFRTSSDEMTRAPELFSGIISENLEAGYDFENQITWRQDQPLPSTILAIMPQLHTQDRG